jgi:tight adherence protein C
MSPYTIVIALMGAISIFSLMLAFFASQNPLVARIEAMQQVTEKDAYKRRAKFAQIFGGENSSSLQGRLLEAGWYNISPTQYSIRGLIGFFIGVCVAVVLAMNLQNKSMAFFIGAGIALIGWRYTQIALTRAIKARKIEIERSLPDFLDMLSAVVQAGLSLNAAIIQSVETATGPLKSELQSTLVEINLGRPRSDALNSMADRVNIPQVSTMVTAIVQAERLGSDLSTMLKNLAIDTRHHRWALAEERAAKLPLKMMFPMAFLMLPSLYMMIFGPVIANVLTMFGNVHDSIK